MKHIFILAFLFSNLVYSQFETLNKTRYIWAESGLSLRSEASADAQKLTVIPYGETVEFIEDTYNVFTVQETKDFKYTDSWLKIKYKNFEGYAFGGYISKMPPPNKNEVSVEEYLNRTLKLLDKTVIQKYKDCVEVADQSCISEYTLSFNKGVSYNSWQGEGGGTETLVIPNINLLQAFILGTHFCDMYDQFPFKYYETPLEMIIIERDDVGCDFTVVSYSDVVIIKWSAGC